MNWMRKLMAGRSGSDQLSLFLLAVSLVFSLIGRWTGLSLLVMAGYGVLAAALFRVFSKKIYQRRMENQRFMEWARPLILRFHGLLNRAKNFRTHAYVKCPQCGKTLRVPKGKGRIRITCPSCRTTMIRKV